MPAIRTKRKRAPSPRSIAVRCRCRSFTTPVPMVPKPIRPARISRARGMPKLGQGNASAGAGAALRRRERPGKRFPDAAHRLAGAMLVLDQREAHVLVTVLAESDPGRHGDLAFLQQKLRELDR